MSLGQSTKHTISFTDEGSTKEKFRRNRSLTEGNTTKPHKLREPEYAAET